MGGVDGTGSGSCLMTVVFGISGIERQFVLA
jgi:hypothetical protein